jgi:hypothetical protein
LLTGTTHYWSGWLHRAITRQATERRDLLSGRGPPPPQQDGAPIATRGAPTPSAGKDERTICAWHDLLRTVVAGRLWILVGHLGALVSTADDLLKLGACGVLLVGYGLVPVNYNGAVIEVSRPDHGAREIDFELAESPLSGHEQLKRFDPNGEAVVLGGGFYDRDTLWGRPYFGGRAASWQALEDKTAIDRLWDDMGVRRAPSLIVEPAIAALVAAAEELDVGKGTVWSGERTGRHPADTAELVFWVRDHTQSRHAARALVSADRGVRVMPYLEGDSCSIHAIVAADAAAVLRPVEVITLARPEGGFVYAGTSTWWDPSAAQREEMRALARSVASYLGRELSYRGAFTIDGLLTPLGFVPTELNPRWGAGLWPQAMVCPLPLRLIDSLVTSGLDGPMDLLEELVVGRADTTRFGGPTLRAVPSGQGGSLFLRAQGSGLAPTEKPTQAVARLSVVETSDGVTVAVRPTSDLYRGRTLRPLAKAGFELADRVFGTHIGHFL